MTQSSENTDVKIANNISNSTSDASVSNNESEFPLKSVETKNSGPNKMETTSLWQKIVNIWNNLPIKVKLTFILLICASVPVIVVTQGIVEFTKQKSISALQKTLDTDLILLEKEIGNNIDDLKSVANTLAFTVEASNINPQFAKTNAPGRQQLQSLITNVKNEYKNINANFYIITDNEGKTVAQFIQTLQGDFKSYPLLPTEKDSNPKFNIVELQTNIPLDDVPIVNNTLKLSQSLHGFESLKVDVLKRLSLDKQANIGLRQQTIEELPDPKKPYPEGTFDVENGQAGFVLMATRPIKIQNQTVGSVIIGTLLNRNFDIVDRLKEETDVATATIFGQDWRISTNVPYTDQKTRAIGTRVSREVADLVLNKQEVFSGRANIIGIEYLTGYAPIYNHSQQIGIDPQNIKPTGIAYVGEPITEINQNLKIIGLVGYVIGGLVIVIVASIIMVTPSDTGISRQLKELTDFATKVASGESRVRLQETKRQDEIGVLTRKLNEMAEKIYSNLEARQQEIQKQIEQRDKLEEEIYQLLDEVQGAVDGDLTVRASLSSLEISTVADLFNAIIDNLKDIALQVKQSTSQVTSSLGKNEQSLQQLAGQAIEETEETNKTLGSIQEMSQSIEDVATNANQAATLANEAYTVTQEGTSAMNKTVNGIVGLRNTVGETAKKIKRLGESSQKISQVVSLIEEIALKTNLLAINASVEASRAGEEGQGFSIVAEQVATLAEQSATATKDITQILGTIQLETQEVSEAMELGTVQVVDTTRLVETTKKRLEEVLKRSQSINELMQSISQATISQTDTSRSVMTLMGQITKHSEERLFSFREVAKSMENTAKVANELESAVEQFKVD